VEVVGYWSMLDVFVVALLTGVVQFGVLAQVVPLPGVIWFGLMVVLTMLASMSFDPRLIWDNANHD
jgi:paraquat-inducible protein A